MKAMLLCAGFGRRLGELTSDTPKPLLPLDGQPLAGFIMRNLARHGFTDIVVNLHYRAEKIREKLGDGSAFGVRIRYLEEKKLLGTAGAVKNAGDFFETEPDFLVHYGDVLTDQDFSAMLAGHRKNAALATLLLHHNPHSNSRVVMDPDGRITSFQERPTREDGRIGGDCWANSGVYICRRDILERIPPGQPVDFPRDIFSPLAGSGLLYGFPLSGYRCAVDSPERYEQAQRAVAEGRLNLQ